MRIISKKTLKDFYEQSQYKDSKNALEAWHKEVLKLNWSNPNEIKDMYRSASIIGDTKVVFNIAGNKYRLLVTINYSAKIIFIKFKCSQVKFTLNLNLFHEIFAMNLFMLSYLQSLY